MKHTGICKWWNQVKGFGFIACDDRSVGDCFVHFSDVVQAEGRKSLVQGGRVEFEVTTTEKGLRAKNVVALPETPANAPPASW